MPIDASVLRFPKPSRLLTPVLCLFLLPALGHALTLTKDTVWSGEVRVEEDVLVPAGVTLTILPGARVSFAEASSTKTDPQFWNPDTEIAVEGRLSALATEEAPIRFLPEGASWGGLVAAPGSVLELRHAQLRGASEAILAYGGAVRAQNVSVADSEYGLVLGEGATLEAGGVKVSRCRKGVLDLRGGALLPEGVVVEESRDAAFLAWQPSPPRAVSAPAAHSPELVRELLGEYTVQGEEVWAGSVVVSGRVTVPPESRLTLSPGTRVSFRKVDTNGDGLGEGELLVLGSVRSLGTAARPVVFESAELRPAPGDWDKVSIITSEDPDNRFEHTLFRHGAMALHSHFSRLSVVRCRFEANLRAVQFQESEGVSVEGCEFTDNKQALRFRDSTVRVEDCVFDGNLFALHAFRADLTMRDNVVRHTRLGGILAKESRLTLENNRFLKNRSALRVRGEGTRLAMRGNKLEGSAETLLSLSDAEATLEGNRLADAGLDLLGVEGGKARLSRNVFGKSGRDALHLNGAADVDARGNEWNGKAPERIFDGNDAPGLGIVLWSPVLNEPHQQLEFLP